LRWRHKTQVLHHTQELVRCNVQWLWSVEVLETWFKENSLSFDLGVKSGNRLHRSIFFSVCEHLSL
jgi:hypothetical protein